jgi:carbon storage regulator
VLVLSRRVEESLNIGDQIVITVLGVEGDKVKLGIKAPREIPILRQEVFQAVQEQECLKSILEADLHQGIVPPSFQGLREYLAAEEASLPSAGTPGEVASAPPGSGSTGSA